MDSAQWYHKWNGLDWVWNPNYGLVISKCILINLPSLLISTSLVKILNLRETLLLQVPKLPPMSHHLP